MGFFRKLLDLLGLGGQKVVAAGFHASAGAAQAAAATLTALQPAHHAKTQSRHAEPLVAPA
jgi:hypothetical protein